MKIFKFAIFALISVLLVACGGANTNAGSQTISVSGGTYVTVSVAELQTMLEEKDFLFVNTHIPFVADIPGTDLTIPFDEIEQNLTMLPADKNAKIVLYCQSARMSGIAAEVLVGLGYTNIYNLDGGFVAWEQAGLPLEK